MAFYLLQPYKISKSGFWGGSKNPLFLTFSKNAIFGVWGVPDPLWDPFLTTFWPLLDPLCSILMGKNGLFGPMPQKQWFQGLARGTPFGTPFGTPKISDFGSTKGNTRVKWKSLKSGGSRNGSQNGSKMTLFTRFYPFLTHFGVPRGSQTPSQYRGARKVFDDPKYPSGTQNGPKMGPKWPFLTTFWPLFDPFLTHFGPKHTKIP